MNFQCKHVINDIAVDVSEDQSMGEDDELDEEDG